MDIVEQVVLNAMTPSIGLAGLTWLGGRARQKLPERRRWRLHHPATASICLAQSVTTHTGYYERPSTGIGQARALAIISPSLVRAYPRFDTQRLCFPGEFRTEIEQDVIVLGGPKNNDVAAEVLEKLKPTTGVELDPSVLVIPGKPAIPLNTSQQNQPVTVDYGVIARIDNPFSARPHKIILLSGAHTYGVVAAARYFVQSVKPFGRKFSGDFMSVVESAIHNGHVLPPKEHYFKEL